MILLVRKKTESLNEQSKFEHETGCLFIYAQKELRGPCMNQKLTAALSPLPRHGS